MRTTLQYYMHDEPDAFRLELSGALEGDGAQDVYHAWKTALSIVGARPFIVDLTYVSATDDYGRALVRLWRDNGVRIVGEGRPDEPPKPTLTQRFSAIFSQRRNTAAEPPAGAGHTPAQSAPPSATFADFTALFDSRPMARRLR